MHTQTETHKSPLARYLILILALTAALIAGTALGSGQQAFAAGSSSGSGAPTKTVTPNKNNDGTYDGTYTLKLSVTGQSSSTTVSTPTEAVLVIDVSGSMDDPATTPQRVAGTPSNDGKNYYGYTEEEYCKLTYYKGRWIYQSSNGEWYYYRGIYYTATSRLDVAKAAAETTVKQLLDSGVTVKLVTFSTKASEAQTLTSSNYASVIDGLKADGGTNWEAGLTNAEAALTKDGKTNENVIFMSDGNPTFRNSRNGYYDYNQQVGVYGNGNSDPNDRNYNAAKTVANSIVEKAEFYSIGVFGNVTKMQNLAKNYYSASDSASLQAAFADIVKKIQNTISRTNFKVTDTLTKYTDSTVTQNATYNQNATYKEGNADNFKYEITDADGTITPSNAEMVGAATVSGKTINWTPKTPTENGQTYSVSVIIWPNQVAVDEVAESGKHTQKMQTNDGKDDKATYDEVKTTTQSDPTAGISGLTKSGSNYTYTYTKNGQSTTIPLKSDGKGGYTATDGSGATLQQKDGVWTLTVPTVTKFAPGEMNVEAKTLTINKVWNNDATSHDHDSITVKITKDGEDTKNLTIDSSGNWKADMALAPGLQADVDGDGNPDLLNKGHIYQLSESSLDTAHYTVSYSDDGFKTGFKPMIVNGQLELEGLTNNSASLTITNTRKEIKTGVKNTDNTAPMVGAGLALAALAAVFVFKRKLGR
ncbi:VWA domain-containing protein [Pseudoramibacter sp.]|jgi:hypothetical protein|uniref:VWA domain-containing protein n=1 Tax=Pseudoramibacter sp. TaxID=2034862 RepID=UPI0025FB4D7C|nr:VWA domain-containing protein [Pseudoramibacter sp.]MCH4071893.1 VWA domain-containing protein [Pseudoramibacter sp.]MCH4105661.1 VWA domain-containing protein [Pseudoramibacter sp.]